MKTRFPSLLGGFLLIAVLALASFMPVLTASPPSADAVVLSHLEGATIFCTDDATTALALNVNSLTSANFYGTNGHVSSTSAVLSQTDNNAGRLAVGIRDGDGNNMNFYGSAVVDSVMPSSSSSKSAWACNRDSFRVTTSASATIANVSDHFVMIGLTTPVTQGGVSIDGVYLAMINAIASTVYSATYAA